MYCQYQTYKVEVYEIHQQTRFSPIKTKIFKWNFDLEISSPSEEEGKITYKLVSLRSKMYFDSGYLKFQF